MNKINYLTFSGASMALAGITMLISESIGISIAQILVSLLFITGGIFAYLFAQANQQHKLANQYHLLQAIGLCLFGVLIATMPDNLKEFLNFITYFIIVFGFVELLFGFMALTQKQKLNMSILISRFLAGFTNLIGGVLLLAISVSDEITGLMMAGAMIFIGGIAFIMFSFRIKKL